ncbi:MAG: hypothetical protein JWP95_1487 [Actinotalea sp.]|nr:hypothetical protein [Actinotalea sp.]
MSTRQSESLRTAGGARSSAGRRRSSVRPGRGARVGVPTGTGSGTVAPGPSGLRGPAPLPDSAVELLARSDAELVAAQLASDPRERFLHAHLAAIRAGAAVLQVTGRPTRRPAPRTVWEMVALVAPELGRWTAFFADGAALRAAIEAGRDDGVDDVRAERTVSAAEDFQDAVRGVLAPDGSTDQRRLALRAS